jgi:hypothetical protein
LSKTYVLTPERKQREATLRKEPVAYNYKARPSDTGVRGTQGVRSKKPRKIRF